jgi:hypothetical protein
MPEREREIPLLISKKAVTILNKQEKRKNEKTYMMF